jgi:predicted nucleic acid-binding protein
VAAAWAGLQARHSKTGRTLAALDSLIAATSVVHDLDLVTRNVRDYENLGIEIVNPWEG